MNFTAKPEDRNLVTTAQGGKAFATDIWQQLDRILVIGTEGGTFYANQKTLTEKAINVLDACLQEDGIRTVNRAVEISTEGRAPKNDWAIFALARAAVLGDLQTRSHSNQCMTKVCRTGTHLFQWVGIIKGMGFGLSASRRGAVKRWYTERNASSLSYQIIKYRGRKVENQRWTHRDVLRLARPKVVDEDQRIAIDYAVHGWDNIGDAPHPNPAVAKIWAFEKLAQATNVKEVIGLITKYNLPHDVVDGKWKGGEHAANVWKALVESNSVPFTALMRNLGNMSKHGYLKPNSRVARVVAARLTDEESIRKSRVHPFSILTAWFTYKSGKSIRGTGTWTVSRTITNALEQAFYASFKNVENSGKNFLLALDVSGSMANGEQDWYTGVMDVPGLSPRIVSAAIAMVFARTQENCDFIGFSHQLIPLNIQAGDTLDKVVKTISGLPFGRTYCNLPVQYAIDNRKNYDGFVILTDNETAQTESPSAVFSRYKRTVNKDARYAVMAMTAGDFTLAAPNDPQMLDIAGLDSAAPKLVSDFVAGFF